MALTLSRAHIEERVRALGPWFHNLRLDGVETAPGHFLGNYPEFKWNTFRDALPVDLTGKSVLDIGCNAGFYSVQMKMRGAERVLGIDHDEDYLAQARFVAEVLGLDIAFEQKSVYQVAELGERFDIVLFMGVLYHLRHPLLALDLIRQHVAKDLMVFQSLLRGSRAVKAVEADYPFSEVRVFDDPSFPRMHFIESRYSQDPTNWWIPNQACALAMLRSAGFRVESAPDVDVFLCRCEPDAELHPLPFSY